jgi:hypothetical protein
MKDLAGFNKEGEIQSRVDIFIREGKRSYTLFDIQQDMSHIKEAMITKATQGRVPSEGA